MAQPARILPFLRRPAPQDPERTELLEVVRRGRILARSEVYRRSLAASL